jgi:glucose-6-phosphate isomerase
MRPGSYQRACERRRAHRRRYHYDRRVSVSALTVEARIPGALRASVDDRLAAATRARVGERLREGDATLWGAPDTPEVANRLGWLTIAERMLGELGALELFAAEVHDDELEDIVLLGMGGSSLAPEVLRRSFAGREGNTAMHVLDSTDAARIRTLEAAVDLRRTLFIVSSKSGGTIEPLSLFAHFFSLVGHGNSFIAITDPGSGLEALANKHAFRRVFHGDPNIGGRYSALSAFGVVPGALMRIRVRVLLEGAADAWDTALGDGSDAVGDAGAVWLGAALSGLAGAGRDKLTFVISETLPGLGLWLEQLVAESTGKRGLRPGSRVRLSARPARARRRARRPRARARRCRTPRDHDAHARPHRPRTRVPAVGADRRGRRLGPRDQPVRPAERAAGEGRDQARARRLRSQARAAPGD